MKQSTTAAKDGTHIHCQSLPIQRSSLPVARPKLRARGILRHAQTALSKARVTVLDAVSRRRHCGESEASSRSIPLWSHASKPLNDERTGLPYISNSIRSSRYTIYNFLPKQLLFQCTRLNNFYFIVIGIPQAIPGFSTTGNFTTILPLLFFILLTILKEGYDDLRRHRLDKNENKSLTLVLDRGNRACGEHWLWTGLLSSFARLLLHSNHAQAQHEEKEPVESTHWQACQWHDVRVGDIVQIERDGTFPADVVLLCTNEEASVAFIETMALDGETSLKSKQAPQALSHCIDRQAIESCTATLVVEQPNKDLYSFEGHISQDNRIIPLSLQQIILRGSVLRNTKSAIGIVINTGEECKIRMNANHHPKAKKPQLERWSNYIVLILIAYVVLLSVGCSIGYIVWQNSFESKTWYLTDAGVPFKQIIIGYGIMYNNVIPLALYISLEIVKLGQMLLVSSDINMFDEATEQKMRCNTNTILENLGQVDYVLTDKTGTLTENSMVFKGFSVGGYSCRHDVDTTSTGNQVAPPREKTCAKPSMSHIEQTDEEQPASLAAGSTAGPTIAELIESQTMPSLTPRVKTFLLTMALCHTCLPAETDSGAVEYQASSPDELALVKAASELGYSLKSRNSTTITIAQKSSSGEPIEHVFEILDVIEFSSNRKRMSILLRDPDGQLWLLCKGADSVIVPRLQHASMVDHERRVFKKSIELQREKQRRSLQAVRAISLNRPSVAMERLRHSIDVTYSSRSSFDTNNDESPRSPLDRYGPVRLAQRRTLMGSNSDFGRTDVVKRCFQHLEDFAVDGLRTLMYARKAITENEYQSWKKVFSEANSSISDRQARIESAADEIEHSMDLIGVTAIEDKLQRYVPETIDKLRRANIRIWMLTGDKRETAISIAHSSRICYSESLVLTIDSTRGDLEQQLQNALHDMSAAGTHNVAVIDGHTLSIIEESDALINLFYMVAIRVDSVICCRASPSQKAALVYGIRKHAPKKLTLTIGDGANDVAMIQAAHVGIGMMGREGMQAARVADYCIAQFSFLQRLLLVHGRWNYMRTAKFILNTFWKEMLFYLPQTLYQIHTGYSGSSLYENWSLTALNTLFTSLAVVLPGIFEQDLRAETLLSVPELYVYGQKNRALNLSAFILLMAGATIEGMITWHLPYALYGKSALMSDNGAFALGHMNFSLAIIWTNWKLLLIDTHYKSKIILGGFTITVAGWWIWSAFLSGVYTSNMSPFDVRGGFFRMFGNDPAWWATLVITLVALILTDLVIRATRGYLITNGRWPLWTSRDERRFQARELEAWQEIEHDQALESKQSPTIHL